MHLTRIAVRRPLPAADGAFPFGIPAIRSLPDLRLDTPVTLLVGENGSGKSTLLEALAIGAGLPTAGAAEAADDATLAGPRALAGHLRLSWASRRHRGFYLRAEDFFGFARRMADLRSGLERELAAVDAAYADRPGLAHDLARTPLVREIGELEARYGAGLDARSHGEAFLAFFGARAAPGGLYLLDEPEAPLSPSRQLALIALLREMVASDCQLIIATHSPLLLAFPGAAIWSFDHDPVQRVAYADLEHVRLTRDFLNDPEAFLRHL